MDRIFIVLLISVLTIPFLMPLFIEKQEVPVIYQLGNVDINEITLYYKPEYIIIDYSHDGSEKNKFSRYEIRKLQTNGSTVLSYLSVGEAEDYRFYWEKWWNNSPPDFIGEENSKWPGNYKVKYWHWEWKEIMHQYIDKIIDQGFDGVYIDLVDSYLYWADHGYDIYATAEEMINLIADLSEYAKSKRKNFKIFVQNAESIIDYDYNGKYMESIDGLGIESLFYIKGKKRKEKQIDYRLNYITKFKEHNKTIIVIDYIYNEKESDIEKVKDFISLCEEYGFLAYPATKDQKLYTISPGIKYFNQNK
ncbi:hypothetical protein XO10_09030 [Marinitoga sp. 1135]|uniref:MJ1477/TM1410 family putative glycoside hydrolase n=1 Tax=Marinitoga sp. 1135 TaxID=1643333 RepID=UPI0015861168|nr:MJ1477/TM1410 family putative glycoside hydrolase [Marinitoga sp. 1135]NUU96398.1 hypothetical protein [Marinitoga sp. 1135]